MPFSFRAGKEFLLAVGALGKRCFDSERARFAISFCAQHDNALRRCGTTVPSRPSTWGFHAGLERAAPSMLLARSFLIRQCFARIVRLHYVRGRGFRV